MSSFAWELMAIARTHGYDRCADMHESAYVLSSVLGGVRWVAWPCVERQVLSAVQLRTCSELLVFMTRGLVAEDE